MIYLDYASSAPVYTEVCALTVDIMANIYGNPSSLHSEGNKARRLLRESRQDIAFLLGFNPENIIFTSGGTEANNTAIMSVRYGKRKNIVVGASEHHSVLNAAEELKKFGFTVTYVIPDACGRITPDAVKAVLTEDTALLSIQAVNNETGVVQDITAMAELAHSVGALYHCDAVQSFGHIPLPLDCADMVSLSGHKFGGPRGVGVLAAKPMALGSAYMFGGKQEFGLRAGTENLPAIAGLALATKMACAELDSEYKRLHELSKLLLNLLKQKTTALRLTSGDALRVPNILSIRFPDMSAEELMTQLSEKSICIGAGAACTMGDKSPSHVLTAMGLAAKEAKETVRISLGRRTSEEEIRITADAIAEIYCK